MNEAYISLQVSTQSQKRRVPSPTDACARRTSDTTCYLRFPGCCTSLRKVVFLGRHPPAQPPRTRGTDGPTIRFPSPLPLSSPRNSKPAPAAFDEERTGGALVLNTFVMTRVQEERNVGHIVVDIPCSLSHLTAAILFSAFIAI